MEKSCTTCKWSVHNTETHCSDARKKEGGYKGVCASNYSQWEPIESAQPKQPLVTIPKDVAEAIEGVRSRVAGSICNMTNWTFLADNFRDEKDTLVNFFLKNPHEYIRAIQEGYEVDKTPKEQIIELKNICEQSYIHYKGNDIAELSEWKVKTKVLEEVIKIMGWEEE